MVGSEAGAVAPEVGLARWKIDWGFLPASPSVSTEAEDLGEGQGWLS